MLSVRRLSGRRWRGRYARQIGLDHQRDQLIERRLRHPMQDFAGARRVGDQHAIVRAAHQLLIDDHVRAII